MKDKLIICSGENSSFRIYICDSTQTVTEARATHNMWPSATVALGRTLTIGSILAAMLKERQSLAINIEGDGPLKRIIVEADYEGHLTGRVSNPQVFLENNDGKINVGKSIGQGELTVIKNLHLKEPYISTVPLFSGEIAEDFAYYFTVSEQVPSSVALGVMLDENQQVKKAGGFLVQALPGAHSALIAEMEERLKGLPPITYLLSNHSLEEIATMIDPDCVVLGEREISYNCSCTKQRFREGMLRLGIPALEDICLDESITTKCHYCGREYTYDKDDLISILNVAKRLNETTPK